MWCGGSRTIPPWRRPRWCSCASIDWGGRPRFRTRSPACSGLTRLREGAISRSACRLATSSLPSTCAAKAYRCCSCMASRLIAPCGGTSSLRCHACGASRRISAESAARGRAELTRVAEREGQGGVIERLLPRLLAPATQATQPEVAAQVHEMARRWSLPGLVGALRVLRDRPDSTETLRGVRVPTLVLVGSEDEIAPPDAARAMAQLIPDAQYHVVPAAGHIAPLEQPLAASRLLADFLSALPSP